ncbi:MAG TPA: DUF4350 domain-containing protein [Candidatus Thermoplasmatota archaeon]|nr:DUF4350 domain-containing protein [Candidatus Thermoplasmatota archaeon]
MLVLGGVAYAVLAPPPHLGAWRTGPENLVEFRRSLEGLGYGSAAIGVSPHALSALGAPERTLVVVAGVETSYRPGEIEAIQEFVQGGGKLLVADDFGFANALSDGFGVNFDKLRLFDENYVSSPNLTVVRATLGPKTYPVVLNVPTSLSVRNPDAVVLAVTSEKAYLDANANELKDDEDVQGASIVAVAVPFGKGRAVFLGDPAPLTDEMLGQGKNRDFLLTLVGDLLPDGGTVLFDESRHSRNVVAAATGEAVEVLVVTTHEGGLRWLVLGTLAIAGATWLRLRRREEALGHHVAHLDAPVRVAASAERDRLGALARARMASVHGLASDAPPQSWRDAARDEVVGRLAAGDDGLNIPDSLDDTLQRIQRYGRETP